MKKLTIVTLTVVALALGLCAGYALAVSVPVQQKVDYVTDLRQTSETILTAIDHLNALRDRQISHGGAAWIATEDMSMTVNDGITGAQVNAAAAYGPTLKGYLDANGGAIRAALEAVR